MVEEGLAWLSALRAHELRRTVTSRERAVVSSAMARAFLRRALLQRGRRGYPRARWDALTDVLRAVEHSPPTALGTWRLGVALGAMWHLNWLPRPGDGAGASVWRARGVRRLPDQGRRPLGCVELWVRNGSLATWKRTCRAVAETFMGARWCSVFRGLATLFGASAARRKLGYSRGKQSEQVIHHAPAHELIQ